MYDVLQKKGLQHIEVINFEAVHRLKALFSVTRLGQLFSFNSTQRTLHTMRFFHY